MSLTNYLTINQGTSDKYSLVCFQGCVGSERNAECGEKAGSKHLYQSLWEQQSPMYTSLPLTPYVSTCFPFLFGVSAKYVTQGASRVSGAAVCVGMGCQALFTLASTSCGYQLPAKCHPAITASAPHTLLPLPGSHLRLDIQCRISRSFKGGVLAGSLESGRNVFMIQLNVKH